MPDKFIEDSVDLLKNDYFKRMLRTKRIFFQYLQERKPLAVFSGKFLEIWSDLDYQFMNSQKAELESLIDELNRVKPDGKTKEYLEMIDQSKFDEVFKKYEATINKYYESRLSTINKNIRDVDNYLTNFVDKYDDFQAMIPYYTKNGLLHSYHNIDDYSSMLFNTNLLRTSINRTLFDADYLDMDLIYIPTHNLSCPRCMEWQGRVYSKSGKDKRYPKLDEAYSNGLGHPNCKHIPTIYWDSSQLQNNKFDTDDWKEKYEIDQKRKALTREIKKQNTNLQIYKELGNQTKIDSTKAKLAKLRNRRSDI